VLFASGTGGCNAGRVRHGKKIQAVTTTGRIRRRSRAGESQWGMTKSGSSTELDRYDEWQRSYVGRRVRRRRPVDRARTISWETTDTGGRQHTERHGNGDGHGDGTGTGTGTERHRTGTGTGTGTARERASGTGTGTAGDGHRDGHGYGERARVPGRELGGATGLRNVRMRVSR